MRRVINGAGVDVTSTVLAYQRSNRFMYRAHLYLIGEAENPFSIWLTDWDSPLLWSFWGKFLPTVITRDSVTTQVGLDPQKVNVTWTPKSRAYSQSITTASPRQLAQADYYRNWKFRIWECYMPTPGDANTYGASELFGGRIGDVDTARDGIVFTVESMMNIFGHQLPPNVIEVLNTSAAYKGATPPSGFVRIPQFLTFTGSSPSVVVGIQTFPVLNSILDTNNCQGGFLVFNSGGTLDGVWAAIQQNTEVIISGGHYNQFVLYSPLPWAPTPGLDTFYVSGPSPILKTDAEYIGFPYVPPPTQGF